MVEDNQDAESTLREGMSYFPPCTKWLGENYRIRIEQSSKFKVLITAILVHFEKTENMKLQEIDVTARALYFALEMGFYLGRTYQAIPEVFLKALDSSQSLQPPPDHLGDSGPSDSSQGPPLQPA